MASFQKYGKGWRAFIRRKGVSKTGTFATKREAMDWAAREEAAIIDGERRAADNRTFRDALDRYEREVTPTKRSKSEHSILNTIRKSSLAGILLSGLDASHIAQYRDMRLEAVKPGTVLREVAIMSHICTVAVKEWRWMKRNPCVDVRKPSPSQPRDRRVTQEEIDALKAAGKYHEFPATVQSLAMHAFLFALETAMRAGEIVSLTWDNVDFDKRTAYLPRTKNGTARTVPLSSEAVRLLCMLPRDGAVCFPLKAIGCTFRDVKRKAGIKDLHFHDSRHEAITRLAKKLDVLALARMVGHKRIQQLMTYYNESAEDIAKKLS